MNEQTTFNFASWIEAAAPENQTFTIDSPLVDTRSSNSESELARPIHYLGSKLRIVDSVREVLDGVDPSAGPVCDLFAGSGTVSRELAFSRTVVAVDIQEYSRVLCSALLNPPTVTAEILDCYLSAARSSEHARRLSLAIEPMIAYEASCRLHAEAGHVEPLCNLLEQGSIVSFEQNPSAVNDANLFSALKETSYRLRGSHLIDNERALTSRYFGGIYFSYAQASELDMLLEAATDLPLAVRDTFLAAILSTASGVVNTVGKQFAQPIRPRFSDGRPKPNLAGRVSRDRNIDALATFELWINRYRALESSGRQHRALRSDYVDALKSLSGQVGIIYADPPYTRDHYSRYYHVLETLCLRDSPTVSKVRINGYEQMSRGIYRVGRYQSPFCIKTKVRQAFATLFSEVRRLDAPLVVSYSPFEKHTGARPRLMAIGDIAGLARKSFRRVEVLSAGRIAHSKLNRSDMNKPTTYGAESFLICEP